MSSSRPDTAQARPHTYIGQALRRREDIKFVTGRGRYVDDVAIPDLLHVVLVRSPHAHARIVRISCERAAALPGVRLIVTGADWAKAGFDQGAVVAPLAFRDGRPMNTRLRPVFAQHKVCHVGDVVAAVVAETRYSGLDAAEAVEVSYEVLPAVTDTAQALAHGAPVIHGSFQTNHAVDLLRGDPKATQAAFATAAHVTSLELISPRIAGVPLEPTAYAASHDRVSGETTLWASHQLPHVLRQHLCRVVFGIPENKLRVIAPDVGGGFGVKGSFMPEVSIVTWLARELGGAVKWTATRSEALLTETQARDHVSTARMAFDESGLILGLAVHTTAAFGAYVASNAPSLPSNSYPHAITGLYRTPNLGLEIDCVYTNTAPIAPYRGTGRPEATLVNERLVENGARELGIDVVEMRRRNLIQEHQYPYKAPVGRIYDSGNPPALLDKLIRLSRYNELRAEQQRMRAKGELLGIGLAAFLDKSGAAPSRQLPNKVGMHSGYESANVRIHTDGKATLLVGTHSHGQGHDITYAAIAADELGIPIEDIDIVEGDTGRVQYGNGTWGSRSLSVAGCAIQGACRQIMDKARRIAAHVLECDAQDLRYDSPYFVLARSNQKLSFAEIAGIAYSAARLPKRDGFEPGLEALVFYDPVDLNDPLAMHLAVVEIDQELGAITLREYYSVDDCGVVVNPMIVEGQIHGGIAQGIGQAMMERIVYDRQSGQLLTGSLMDYALPRASDMPPLKLDFHVTPAPGNPLGVKGGAESGPVGPPAAIANAVVDALWHLGVRQVELPLTPYSVWRTLQAARKHRQ
jgi:carbon-monoxide dehydrogenase large subunit